MSKVKLVFIYIAYCHTNLKFSSSESDEKKRESRRRKDPSSRMDRHQIDFAVIKVMWYPAFHNRQAASEKLGPAPLNSPPSDHNTAIFLRRSVTAQLQCFLTNWCYSCSFTNKQKNKNQKKHTYNPNIHNNVYVHVFRITVDVHILPE